MSRKEALVMPLLRGATGAAEKTWRAAKGIGGGNAGGALVLGGTGLGAAAGLPIVAKTTTDSFRDSMAQRNQFKGAEMSPLDRCYVALAKGEMTEAEVAEVEKFAEALKEGIDWGGAGQVAKNVGMNAAGATAAALAIGGVAKGINAAVDMLTYAGDFKSMMSAHPQLADYPEEQVRAIYATLRHLNPAFAKDPLVAGTFVFRNLQNRSGDAPHAKGMIELGTAKDLAQSNVWAQQPGDPTFDAVKAVGQQAMKGFPYSGQGGGHDEGRGQRTQA